MTERDDNSPVTWRELREAMALVVDFQMKILAMSAATISRGRENSLAEEQAAVDAADNIERTYRIDEIARDR